MTDFNTQSSDLNKPLSAFNLPINVGGFPNSKEFILSQFGLQGLRVATFNDSGAYNADPVIRKSQLGTSVHRFAGVEFPDYNITFDTVLIDVSQTKNIVKTSIQGRDYTIKEYISEGDYEVTIRGVINGTTAEAYPENEVSALIQMSQVNESIKIVSAFVQLFGFDRIVIEDFSLPQTEGNYSIQAFQIRGVSDSDLLIQPVNA